MSKTFDFPPSQAHLYPSSGSSGASLPDAAASGALGLVHSSTSDTRRPFDPVKARLKRLKQGVITGARLHTEETTRGGFRVYGVMLTLTYREGLPWEPRHIADLMKHIRQWMNRRGVPARYVWAMELHKSGLPHYHVVLWLPKGISLPKPDKRGWWPHGSTRIEKAKNAVGYIAKYASKGDTGRAFPEGARIHACGGLDMPGRLERSWWLCPAWVRQRWPSPAYSPRPFKGGGWFSPETGEWEDSPFVVVFEKGNLYIYPKRRE